MPPSGLLMPSHLLILGLVALLVFGPKRLPEIARSVGTGLRSFRDALTEPAAQEPDEATATAPLAARSNAAAAAAEYDVVD